MKKWYVIIAILLGFILISSTNVFALSLTSSSDSKESEQNDTVEEAEPAVETNDEPTISSDDSGSGNSDTQSYLGNEPPVADFYYEQDENDKFIFYFFDDSYDTDGEVIYWEWNFNDGSPDAVSYEQDPIHDFEKFAGKDVKVYLTVRDDGSPPLTGTVWKIISIPSGTPVSEDLESNRVNVKSLKTEFPTTIITTSAEYIQKLESKMNKVIVNKNIYYTVLCDFSKGSEPLCFDPPIEIDLYTHNQDYTPKKPKAGDYVTFYFYVEDGKDNYTTSTVIIKLEFVDTGFTAVYSVDFIEDTLQSVLIQWPQGVGDSDVCLWIIARDHDPPYQDQDPQPNYKIFEDVGEGSITISSQSTLIPVSVISQTNLEYSYFKEDIVTISNIYGRFSL